MLIIFTDSNGQTNIHADEQEAEILHIVRACMIFPENFNLIYIDLSDSMECCDIYQDSRRISTMGGAVAWHIYRKIADIFPQINRHTAGRPPVIL